MFARHWKKALLVLLALYLAWRLYRAWNLKRIGAYKDWGEALHGELYGGTVGVIGNAISSAKRGFG